MRVKILLRTITIPRKFSAGHVITLGTWAVGRKLFTLPTPAPRVVLFAPGPQVPLAAIDAESSQSSLCNAHGGSRVRCEGFMIGFYPSRKNQAITFLTDKIYTSRFRAKFLNVIKLPGVYGVKSKKCDLAKLFNSKNNFLTQDFPVVSFPLFFPFPSHPARQ